MDPATTGAGAYRLPVAVDRPSNSPVPALIGGVVAAVVLVILVRVVIGAVFALVKVVVVLGVIAVGIGLYLRAKRSR